MKFSDISDTEFDIDNHKEEKETSNPTVTEDEKKEDVDSISLSDIDVDELLNLLNSDQNNNTVVEKETKTIILELRKKTVKYSDGKETSDRDVNIQFSENIDKKEKNITSIVNKVQMEVNDLLLSKEKSQLYRYLILLILLCIVD